MAGRYCQVRQFCAYFDRVKKKDEVMPPGIYEISGGMYGNANLRTKYILLKSVKSFKRYWPLRDDYEDWCEQKVIVPAK